jgi:SAM-dependent methyltransferase
MFHRHREGGGSAAFWEEFGSEGSFEDRLRFCETDPLRPLFEKFARPGTRMLEGGCGQGQYVAYYAARGVKVVGLDFAREWLGRLRRRDPDIPLCVGDVSKLPYRDESFDVYYSGGVVEHFEAGCADSLREARRVLRPGGTLLISVPYFSPLRRVMSLVRTGDWKRVPAAERQSPNGNLRFFQYCYTPAEFTRQLEGAGLKVIGTQGYAVLWGLNDIEPFQKIVSKLSATRPAAATAASMPAGPSPAGASRSARGPSGARALVKRLVVAEDDSIPIGGWFVRLGRWACANMMMYVCVRA